VDLVVIATPNETHFGLGRAALLAGKHAIIEKPFASSSAQAAELDRLSKERQLVLVPFHNRRWDGDFRTIQKLMREDCLGKLHYFESKLEAWRTDYALDGPDALFDKGPHLVDQALHLFGMPESVSADARIERAQAKVPDFFHAVLRYPGLIAILNASLANHYLTSRFIVHGERASFVKRGIDGQGAAIRSGSRPSGEDWFSEDSAGYGELHAQNGSRSAVATERGDYRIFYEGVAGAVLDGSPPPVTAAEARAVIKVIEACVESANTGVVVRL
jgi:scyllo-inositol 2-dehydrogenase (NADP+)